MLLSLRVLSKSDLPALKVLEQTICNQLDHSEFWIRYLPKEYENFFDENVAFGAFTADNKLIAVGILNYDADHFELDGALVLPEFRNRGLQKQLIKKRLDFAKGNGAKFVHAKCHPDNHPSLTALTGCGFKIQRSGPFGRNGVMRTLLEYRI